jgi:hypothetical protein
MFRVKPDDVKYVLNKEPGYWMKSRPGLRLLTQEAERGLARLTFGAPGGRP